VKKNAVSFGLGGRGLFVAHSAAERRRPLSANGLGMELPASFELAGS
jgi:hypothetical protein